MAFGQAWFTKSKKSCRRRSGRRGTFGVNDYDLVLVLNGKLSDSEYTWKTGEGGRGDGPTVASDEEGESSGREFVEEEK
ncbi:hypothetical protein HPP92_013332 [Vanilla planifolia]|uniref:Uncharacterized protein n=1 Tax=Vanilla planifolia TaxID=51239 RepID=A0A835QSU4_VANPL|nr:hypothetical protein HPP92_013332 [Vanilla planifolia]